ncbi:hypothetical protein BMA10399_D0746 [Burkholderia mallei ATCC 10399]|nr:hypothetical protein BMA10399_D0746 [Burkholderia mallei ATCC 10399]
MRFACLRLARRLRLLLHDYPCIRRLLGALVAASGRNLASSRV